MRTPRDADRALFRLDAAASLTDLKRAYRKAALALHPDQNPDPAAAARFRELTDAYRRLEGRLTPAPRKRPLHERAVWFIAETRSLVRSWSDEHWAVVVDGLPASVWLAGALDVLARLWSPAGPSPAAASPAALIETLEVWTAWLPEHPLPSRLSKAATRPLAAALDAAEARLRAFRRPRRSRSG